MFEQFFGNYLVGRGKLSKEELNRVIQKQKETRAKLGLIAVAEKLLTAQEAEEVNEIQGRLDRRFGDIAVDKGFLTAKQVEHLLNLQGNPYLCFVQSITEAGFMTVEEVEAELANYQEENGFTMTDMEALKSGDVDRIAPLFIPDWHVLYFEYITLTFRMISRILHIPFYFGKVRKQTEYEIECMGVQELKGAHDLFAGLSGKNNNLLVIAENFAREKFEGVNDDAFDAVCEFINCINGMFASNLSGRNIDLEICVPCWYQNRILSSKNQFYVVPLYFDDKEVDLVVAIDIAYDIIDPKCGEPTELKG